MSPDKLFVFAFSRPAFYTLEQSATDFFMQFKQIIGQSSIRQSLTETARAERIPHAQLFLGPCGSGNLALALAYAQYILCPEKSDTDACGSCSSCKKSQKLIHPDIHFSYPCVGSKVVSTQFLEQWRTAISENPYLEVNQWLQAIGAENKQGNINKDECLDIIRKLSLKSFEGAHKILILWLPEYLAKEGNRLLKLIEEPPEDTVFLLVAENQEKILPTILSRCQLVKIPRLTDAEVTEGLRSKGLTEEEQLRKIVYLADGDFNQAIQLIDQQQNDNATILLDWLRKCYGGKGVEMHRWVEEIAKIGRESQKHFLQYGLHFMREFLLLKMTGQSVVRLQPRELETAQKMRRVMDFEQVEKITRIMDHCYFAVERNAHPKILFMDASIKINQILKSKITA